MVITYFLFHMCQPNGAENDTGLSDDVMTVPSSVVCHSYAVEFASHSLGALRNSCMQAQRTESESVA